MRLLGIGLQECERFCAFMDLPRLIFHSFLTVHWKHKHDAVKAVLDMSLIRSAQEEKLKISEAENTDEHVGLAVSGDIGWKKSGFIGYYTNKVIDVVVKFSFCSVSSRHDSSRECLSL